MPSRTTAELLETVEDTDITIAERAKAVHALAEAGEFEELRSIILNDDYPIELRERASRGLAATDPAELERVVGGDAPLELRLRAIDELRGEGDQQTLWRIVNDESEPLVLRTRAVKRLSTTNLERIIESFHCEYPMEVREAAVDGLAVTGDIDKLEWYAQFDSYPMRIRERAVDGIATAGGGKELERIVDSTSYPMELRERAVAGLTEIENREELEWITRFDSYPIELRKRAVDGLAECGDIHRLMKVIDMEHYPMELRERAIHGLWRAHASGLLQEISARPHYPENLREHARHYL